jgi:hypothetical protein
MVVTKVIKDEFCFKYFFFEKRTFTTFIKVFIIASFKIL